MDRLSVEQLSKSFEGVLLLDDVSFSVATGLLFGLLGPNGSGKTTLFRLLATLIPMQSGELSVCGFDVTTQQSSVRRQLGVQDRSMGRDPSQRRDHGRAWRACLDQLGL